METPSCMLTSNEPLGARLPDGEVLALDNAVGLKLLLLIATVEAANEPQLKVAS